MSMRLSLKTLIQCPISVFSRSYYTTKRVTLYSKISPLGDPSISLVPELENWVQHGNKVRVGELQRIIRDLRRRNRFGQALEVCNFVVSSTFSCLVSVYYLIGNENEILL